MRKSLIAPLAAVAACVIVSCNGVPSHVIGPDDMASLMADMRMADAVVGVQYADYVNDANKIALKQAVFKKHGVTEAQFDTSLVWYGHNVDKFQEVNERTIEILEKRLKAADALAAGEAALTVSGDSVDLWAGPSVRIFGPKTGSNRATIGFDTDRNSERGDIYTMRARVLVPGYSSQWGMTVEYTDGTVDAITDYVSQSAPNRQELMLVTDSTRTARHVSGWISMSTPGRDVAVLDSISLTRRHLDPLHPAYQHYRQYRVASKYKKQDADTTAVKP